MGTNDPELLTEGRYVFCPDGTPNYPGWHHLGSRNWTSDERDPAPFLGELDGVRQSWHSGLLPDPYPEARLIGNPDVLAQGDPAPLQGTVALDYQQGYALECFRKVQLPPIPPRIVPNILGRTDQILAAEIIEQLYLDPNAALLLAQAAFGGSASYTLNVYTDLLPPTHLIIQLPYQTIVYVAGTLTEQQFATQAMYLGLGAIPTGAYSTSLYWRQGAVALHEQLVLAGVDPTLPIYFAGHSNGGVLSCLLAADYRLAHADRVIDVLTMGCPKPGDRRLASLLDLVRQVHIGNDDDPIPRMPPRHSDVFEFLGLVPLALLAQWFQFATPLGTWVLYPSGLQEERQLNLVDFAGFTAWVALVLLNLPLPPFAGHAISEYRLRLRGF